MGLIGRRKRAATDRSHIDLEGLPDRRRSRDMLAAGRQLSEALSRFSAFTSAAWTDASAQHLRIHQSQVSERLRGMPLEELRRGAEQSLRLSPSLEAAGYRDVWSVFRASESDLLRLQGVGEVTANAILAAAESVFRLVQHDTVVRLDADGRDPKLDPLLRALRVLHATTRIVTATSSQAATLTTQLDEAMMRAAPAGSRIRMWVSSPDAKAAATAAVVDLQRLLNGDEAARLEDALTELAQAATEAQRVDRPGLWDHYRRNAAAYNSLLDAVSGQSGSGAAAHGFLPESLQRSAEQVRLSEELLRVTLRGYQVFGAQYAVAQRRCILGDEMGLGKTIQAIAVCAHLAAAGEQSFLVVCPASLVVNWLAEIRLHSGIAAYRLHGPARDDAARQWLANGGIAVTTFETLSRLKLLSEVRAGLVVVDEAQYIKNPAAQRSKAVAAHVARANRVVFLTGTPIMNRVEEFRELVRYLDPRLAETIRVADGLAGAGGFRRKVASLYLRRNQKDVLTELPDLIENEDWIELGHAEELEYRRAVEARSFTAMRQATVLSTHSGTSAKLDRLRQIVAESADNGWKVVVFSYFLDVLDQVRATAGPGPSFLLNGKVPVASRQRLVDEFSAVDGHAVLVSQIGVGGVGLNLPAASVVVLTDPQLTPATEEQAIRRCYRMGQTRGVRVHRLLAKDSIDQRLLETLGHKSALIEAYAKDSVAKLAHPSATDGRFVSQPPGDAAIPLEQRIIMVERQRLGLDRSRP